MEKTNDFHSLMRLMRARATRGLAIACVALFGAGCMEVTQRLAVDGAGFDGSTSVIRSRVDASSATVSADGVTTVTVTVSLENSDGLPIPGHAITLASDRPTDDAISVASGPSDEFGQVTFRVASALTGISTFTATDSSLGLGLVDTAIVTFAATAISADLSILSASDESLLVAGTSTIELEARDALGNLIGAGGSTIAFTLSDPSVGALSAVTDHGDGTYTAVFTAALAGTTDVTATIDGTSTVTTVLSIEVQ
jgi:adhesin/invasin